MLVPSRSLGFDHGQACINLLSCRSSWSMETLKVLQKLDKDLTVESSVEIKSRRCFIPRTSFPRAFMMANRLALYRTLNRCY